MLHLPIRAEPADLFARELQRGFTRFATYVGYPHNGQLFAAYLLREDGTGLRIGNRMNDVGPRFEVGALVMEPVQSLADVTAVYALAERIDPRWQIEKLVLNDEKAGLAAESGIAMRLGAQEIIIVAAGQVFGVCVYAPFRNEICAPEYDLTDDERVAWDGIAQPLEE